MLRQCQHARHHELFDFEQCPVKELAVKVIDELQALLLREEVCCCKLLHDHEHCNFGVFKNARLLD